MGKSFIFCQVFFLLHSPHHPIDFLLRFSFILSRTLALTHTLHTTQFSSCSYHHRATSFRFSLTNLEEVFLDSSSISSIHRRWPRILKLGSIVFPRGIAFIFTFISLSGLSSAVVFFARLNNYLYTQGENRSWPAGSTPRSN